MKASATEPAPTSGVHLTGNRVRFVTAASLFDGHDASINIMRRILQSSGAEVIHLGHNRSVRDVVEATIQEGAQAVALSSYQGGHVEYFKYLRDLLCQAGCEGVRIFGGGGGVITPEEISELEAYGISRIYSPEDGRRMGLQGIINDMLRRSDFDPAPSLLSLNAERTRIGGSGPAHLGRMISFLENHPAEAGGFLEAIPESKTVPVVGITGPGGAGKSSLTDELLLRLLERNPELRVAVLAVDPTRRKTGGALLGDRIRLNALSLFPERSFMRSLATRSIHASVSEALPGAIELMKADGFHLVLLETSGIGQSDSEVTEYADVTLYVMTSEYGAPTQLEKIAMLDYADLVALNKADRPGSDDALQYIRKQVQRNREAFDKDPATMPVYPTIAGRFNDEGVNRLYNVLAELLGARFSLDLNRLDVGTAAPDGSTAIIPADRVRYLSDVSDAVRRYRSEALTMQARVRRWEGLDESIRMADEQGDAELASRLRTLTDRAREDVEPGLRRWLEEWPQTCRQFREQEYVYRVRDKEIHQRLYERTLSGLDLPVLALPPYESRAELTRYYYKENLPGRFPFTAGVFPFRKGDEDPTRMFAGEGGPERTNRRFHYLSRGGGATRLSTAFDSVTLYGEDPAVRPDIYGKIGNSGVSIATLDDCKRLYSGFDLLSPSTSVSMTINGPAPAVLAFFFNTAVDQAVEAHLAGEGRLEEAERTAADFYRRRGQEAPVYRGNLPPEHSKRGLALLGVPGDRFVDAETYANIRRDVLSRVRGTVQADILKEDQAQNTCIFSTPFAVRLMGDIQEHFTKNKVRNFYSVSISGYHIAEAGANPITQLAFTLANGFTYLEYYISRGMNVDSFAQNLSFFFSNGIDAEYAVIGRVARRIWAVALRNRYGASERSQKLKYHIQTSGRSLHAREIDFNDIRTTLQALYALYDNCNSLHTNAYDEAVTTPTEESVRRAMAIQLIINRELGLNKNHNPIQGAYIIEELTDLVEEAVISEFDRLTERGGVPGAMETMYQRSKIQEESLHYEHLKHSGELPIVGINTFVRESAPSGQVAELIRSSDEEKDECIRELERFHATHAEEIPAALARLGAVARRGGNTFEELLETVKVASLGQISNTLYQVGGSYRRNM